MMVLGKYEIQIIRFLYLTLSILVIGISAVNILCAQEVDMKEVRDTLIKQPLINQSLLHSFQTDLILSSSPGSPSEYLPLSLHQLLTNIPPSLSGQFQKQIDVASPWKQEIAKQNELRTIKAILGAVQVGGTAYLLYEHIRKYGLK